MLLLEVSRKGVCTSARGTRDIHVPMILTSSRQTTSSTGDHRSLNTPMERAQLSSLSDNVLSLELKSLRSAVAHYQVLLLPERSSFI